MGHFVLGMFCLRDICIWKVLRFGVFCNGDFYVFGMFCGWDVNILFLERLVAVTFCLKDFVGEPGNP